MFKQWWIQREKIKAVHVDNIKELLSSLGVLDKMEQALFRCSTCNTLISMQNIGAIYPKDNQINFVCARLSCIEQLKASEMHENG